MAGLPGQHTWFPGPLHKSKTDQVDEIRAGPAARLAWNDIRGYIVKARATLALSARRLQSYPRVRLTGVELVLALKTLAKHP